MFALLLQRTQKLAILTVVLFELQATQNLKCYSIRALSEHN